MYLVDPRSRGLVSMDLVWMGLPYPSGNLWGFRGYLYSHTPWCLLKEKNYELFPKSKLPKDALVLPHVWQLRWKQVTKTGEISKMESKSLHWWKQAETRNTLWGNLCSSSIMGSNKILLNPSNHQQLEYKTTRFCHGLHTSGCRKRSIHGTTKDFQHARNPNHTCWQGQICSKASEEPVWTKTIW